MADINENNEVLNDVVSGVEPAKKRSGAIAGGIAAGAIVLVVGGGFAAYTLSDYVKNQVKLRLSKPESYYSWVTEKNSSDLASKIADCYRDAIEKENMGQTFQLAAKYEMNDATKNELLEDLEDYDDEETNQLIDILKGLSSTRVGIKSGFKDSQVNGEVFAEINDDRIASLEFAGDLSVYDIFLRSPGLSEKWVVVPDILEEMDYYGDFECLKGKKLEDIITPDELEGLIVKYVDLYSDLVKDVEVQKKENVTIDDITVEYTVIETTFTAADAYAMTEEFLTSFKNDELLRSVFIDRLGAVTAEEYDDYLDEEISLIQDASEFEVNESAIVKTYVDAKGDIRGFGVFGQEELEDELYIIIGRDGEDIRGEMYVIDDGYEDFRASLSLTENSGVYNGYVEYNEYEDETVKVEFTELSISDDGRHLADGSVSLTTPDDVTYTVDLAADGAVQTCSFDLNVFGGDYGRITIEFSHEDGAEPAVPDKSQAYNVLAEDADFPVDYVERETTLEYLKNILKNIGFSDDISEQYAGEAVDRIYGYDDVYYDSDFGGWDDDSDFTIDDSVYPDEVDIDDLDLYFEDEDVEDMVFAEEGQAYIVVCDSTCYASYYGDDGGSLSYGAKNVDIKGDGEYTVSITADTAGYKKAQQGARPEGFTVLGIQADGIKNADKADIFVKSVKIDGKEIELTGDPDITATEDMFSVMIAINGEGYAFDGSKIGEWTDIEITFDIKGIE